MAANKTNLVELAKFSTAVLSAFLVLVGSKYALLACRIIGDLRSKDP